MTEESDEVKLARFHMEMAKAETKTAQLKAGVHNDWSLAFLLSVVAISVAWMVGMVGR